MVNVRASAKIFAANEAKPAARGDHGGPACRMSVLLLDAAPPAPTDTPRTGEAIRLEAVYLLPSITDVRCLKRIRWLSREGIEPTTLAFERTGFDLDIDLPYVSLGRLEHGQYRRRPLALLRAVPRVVPHLRAAAVIYCFGLDLLALGWLCRLLAGTRARLVYEVADVREIQCGTGPFSRLIRAAEGFLLRRAAALAVTSPAYVDGYYRRFGPLPPVFLIENKFGHDVQPAAIEAVRATPVCREPDVIKIGYFGGIRCMRSLDLLFELAARAGGRVRIHIRGFASTEAIRRRLDEAPANVIVEGPFKPEADMPAMYRAIDLGWVADYHAATNTKMARGNRFYDCCMFGRPMIAQKRFGGRARRRAGGPGADHRRRRPRAGHTRHAGADAGADSRLAGQCPGPAAPGLRPRAGRRARRSGTVPHRCGAGGGNPQGEVIGRADADPVREHALVWF